jgi:general stress protein 26
MSGDRNLLGQEAIDKLKELVDEINMCLFCTDLKTDDGSTSRPMAAQKVCDQGNIWFFSQKSSDKNKAIARDNKVQLFFAHPAKSSYLVVNGEAEIIIDRAKTEELWNPLVKTWFEGGKDDPDISIIKVVPVSAYYWDTDGNQMINFIKMVASAATGKNLVTGHEGSLSID